MDLQNNASFSSYAEFSEECVAKLVHRVLLLYLLAIGSCNSEKRAARLC